MRVDTEDLVTPKMIAERCGVTPAAVSNWSARSPTFPSPVFTDSDERVKSRTVLYLWWQVEAWAKHKGKIS